MTRLLERLAVLIWIVLQTGPAMGQSQEADAKEWPGVPNSDSVLPSVFAGKPILEALWGFKVTGNVADVALNIFQSKRTIRQFLADKCILQHTESVTCPGMRDAMFRSCRVSLAALRPAPTDGVIRWENVRFANCVIDDLRLDSVVLQNIKFQHCHLSFAALRDCQLVNVEFIGCVIDQAYFIECASVQLRFGDMRGGQVYLQGGTTDRLGIWGGEQAAQFRMDNVELRNPYVSPWVASNLDLSRVIVPRTGLVAWQETDADTGGYDRNRQQALYREARQVYLALTQRFASARRDRIGVDLEHRMLAMDRKAEMDGFAYFWLSLWHEYLQGRDGTAPWLVAEVAATVWLGFAVLYGILGATRFAWAIRIPTTTFDEALKETEPVFIGLGYGRPVREYVGACIGFSLDQLVAIGSRAIGIGELSKMVKLAPGRYVSVGLGRVLAAAENLCGLVLLVSFVRAFLRTL